ncbi:MAG: anthranilate synthase component I family protein [Actinobacteria bacterium]|nr:anthranilate synthase component I family protein [Actinomycetota bacterium]
MPDPVDETPGVVRARRRLGRADYLDRIHACLEAITRGDAYQLCLTTTVEVELPPAYDPLVVYLRLRRTSPAPYGGLVRIGDRWLLSSSPERFLAVDVTGRAVTSPIKGTRPRSADAVLDRALAAELAADQKERAENVMIVDLCRNDLSQVSQIGSVQVSELFAVQSHPQVHQLVSTVESRLVTDALGATRALFPAGSMTGAPKRSAMALLAGLEVGPRGAYSGVWGRFGTDGSAELAVVIRSIEIRPGRATLGTGGGITIGSDPVREWDETVLKVRAGLAALGVG